MGISLFSRFCFAVLCFCLLVILWGALVRISHSGDGCGQSWPDCQGMYLIEAGAQGKTWIEWIHRATSGLFGLMVLLLFAGAFCKFPRRHPVRKAVFLVFLFTLSEALIGARLVLAGLTGGNDSLARALTMNLHLLNSLLLVGSLFVTWRLCLGRRFFIHKYLFLFLGAFFLIAFFGSFSSLASTLFPSSSLWEGLSLDFNPTSPWLVRLRLWHPLLALLLGGGFLFYMFFTAQKKDYERANQQGAKTSPARRLLLLFLCVTLLSGVMNLLLLSPVILKLTHLLMVYLLFMSFIATMETK